MFRALVSLSIVAIMAFALVAVSVHRSPGVDLIDEDGLTVVNGCLRCRNGALVKVYAGGRLVDSAAKLPSHVSAPYFRQAYYTWDDHDGEKLFNIDTGEILWSTP